MIFLTVGNWHKGFDRLIKAVDELRAQEVIVDEVIAQIGPGSYKPLNIKAIEYCSQDEFMNLMIASRIVITHAGMGTIGQAVEIGKHVIVVPRQASLGEHVDDHQFATARQLEAEKKVLVAYEVSDLPGKLKEAETFVPVQSTNSGQRIIEIVDEFLKALADKKAGR